MVAIANPAGNIPAVNGALPCEGTKVFPFVLDFTGGKNAYLIDLTQQYNQKQFTTLQTVYIDNSLNTSPTSVVCTSTGHIVTCPALSQGYFALFQPVPPVFQVQSLGAFVVTIQLLNFYIPPAVWGTPAVSSGGLPQIDIPALDAIISGGALNVNAKPFTISGLVDGSGTITLGGTTQSILAANAARQYVSLSNPDTATETLYFCWGAAGAGKIPLLPGATYESGPNVVGDQLFALGATTGHAFTLYSK